MNVSRIQLIPLLLPLALGCATESEPADHEVATLNFGAGPVEVAFVEIDGEAVMDGDIVLGPVDRVRNGGLPPTIDGVAFSAIAPYKPWPNGRIVFEIDTVSFPPDNGIGAPTDFETTNTRIGQAVAQWNNSTLVRLVPRTPSNANEPYVRFTMRTICSPQAPKCKPMGINNGSSPLGLQGTGVQLIRLGEQVSLRTVVHEIGHTVGLFHEQSRNDRDQFVHILWENIASQDEHNFLGYGPLGLYGEDIGAYDLGSVMHYGSYSFSTFPSGPNALPSIIRRTTPSGAACLANQFPVPAACLITAGPTLTTGDLAGITRQVTGDQSGAATRIRNDASESCLRPASGSVAAGAAIEYSGSCSSTSSRRWYAWTMPGASAPMLINLNSRLCLTVSGGTATQMPCTNATNQRFTLSNATGGTKFIQTSSGCLMRTSTGGVGVGPACLNNPSFRWYFN